jgi:hypothetical protein
MQRKLEAGGVALLLVLILIAGAARSPVVVHSSL